MIKKINKISVAQHQLDAAIKLLFEDHDSISVATLLHPAWHILKDLFIRAFGNRAKAATDGFRVYELAIEGQKVRVYNAFALPPDGKSP